MVSDFQQELLLELVNPLCLGTNIEGSDYLLSLVAGRLDMGQGMRRVHPFVHILVVDTVLLEDIDQRVDIVLMVGTDQLEGNQLHQTPSEAMEEDRHHILVVVEDIRYNLDSLGFLLLEDNLVLVEEYFVHNLVVDNHHMEVEEGREGALQVGDIYLGFVEVIAKRVVQGVDHEERHLASLRSW